uniref:SWIM-type domain-containing protein n=1 Tax=Rhizophora mucronata TaxID=61149 RepID=A0A2P2Q130_RHIMU
MIKVNSIQCDCGVNQVMCRHVIRLMQAGLLFFRICHLHYWLDDQINTNATVSNFYQKKEHQSTF